MKSLKAIWQFCAYLFVPQMGRQRHKMEMLKKDITYLIGKERTEGNLGSITPLYVSRILNVPLEDVQKCIKEMGL